MNYYVSSLPINGFISNIEMKKLASDLCQLRTDEFRMDYDGDSAGSKNAMEEIDKLLNSASGKDLANYLNPYMKMGVVNLKEELDRLVMTNDYLYSYALSFPAKKEQFEAVREVFSEEYNNVSAALIILDKTSSSKIA